MLSYECPSAQYWGSACAHSLPSAGLMMLPPSVMETQEIGIPALGLVTNVVTGVDSPAAECSVQLEDGTSGRIGREVGMMHEITGSLRALERRTLFEGQRAANAMASVNIPD